MFSAIFNSLQHWLDFAIVESFERFRRHLLERRMEAPGVRVQQIDEQPARHDGVQIAVPEGSTLLMSMIIDNGAESQIFRIVASAGGLSRHEFQAFHCEARLMIERPTG